MPSPMRRKLIVVAGVLAILFALFACARPFVRWRARVAFADLSRCLVGEDGATSENVVLRSRRHELEMWRSTGSSSLCYQEAERVRDWTSTRLFAWHAREVSAAFDDLVLVEDLPMGTEPRPLSEDDYRRARREELKIAWAMAEREGLVGEVSSATPDAEWLTLDDLRPSLLVPAHEDFYFNVASESLFGATKPGFASSKLYCWADAAGLSCVEHPYEPHRQGHLGGIHNTTAPGRGPLYSRNNELFLATKPEQAIATLSPSLKDTDLSSWAGDGDLSVIADVDKDRPIVSIHARGKLQRLDFEAELVRLFGAEVPLRPAEVGPVRAAFGHLYFLGKRRGRTQLYSVRIGADGALIEPSELATVTTPETGWQVDIAACNPVGDERIVIVSLADETFAVFTGDGKAPTAVHSGETHHVHDLLGCSRGRVLLGAGEAMECTPEGCKRYEAFDVEPMRGPTMEPRFVKAEAVLGDNMLYVWGAKSEWRGGLQMKLAPGAELANAPARMILDDVVDGGELWPTGRVLSFKLFGGPTEALLVVLLKDGRELALRIDADGSVRPEQVRWIKN